MSDYVQTTCIRLKMNCNNEEDIIALLHKEDLLKELKDKYNDFCFDKYLWDINQELESENIRIVHYQNFWFVDLILYNKYWYSDYDLYMSLKEIHEKVREFQEKYQCTAYNDVLILAHTWYNGCDEPYTE